MNTLLPTRQLSTESAIEHRLSFSAGGAYVAVTPIHPSGNTTIWSVEDGVQVAAFPADLQSVDFPLKGNGVVVSGFSSPSTVLQLPTLEQIAQLEWENDDPEPLSLEFVTGRDFFAMIGTSWVRIWDTLSRVW